MHRRRTYGMIGSMQLDHMIRHKIDPIHAGGHCLISHVERKGIFTVARASGLWAEADCVDASVPIIRVQAMRVERVMEARCELFMTNSPSGTASARLETH
jgi:hypothetical protein